MIKKIFETYSIIKIEDLPSVDFSQVPESADSVRKNLLDPPTQFLIKWDITPSFILDSTIIPEGLYTHKECNDLMKTELWTAPEPEYEE
tara:strand:- start:205 stop:471 length:267 start_codon:yes stop_codon:yes gene_type:complete